MSEDLCDLPAYRVAAGVRSGQFSAHEVLESCLRRIEAVEGRRPSTEPYRPAPEDRQFVHAFIQLTLDRARDKAAAIDRAVAAGEDPGPLAGVPVGVKDIFCVEGTKSTAASRILENFIAPYSATPAWRWEQAGAMLLGKLNLDEFTFGSSNESSAFLPPPGNPWDPGRVPGGSSGGSAAAVAAGEVALSLGTDTAGSIRQPAAFCGVVGLKPTYGRVSRYGLIAFASSLDCPGPLSRNVADAALALQVMAGPDGRDATAANLDVPDLSAGLERGVKGLRIGLSPDYFRLTVPDAHTGELHEQAIDPDIEAAVRRAADILAGAGAEIIEPVPMPTTRYAIPAYFVISRVEAASNLHRYDGVKYGYRFPGPVDDLLELYRKTRGRGFGVQPKLRILMGMYVSAEQYEKGYYPRALRVRTLIRRDFQAAFDPAGPHRLDALLAATTPTTAFPLQAVYGDSVLMQYADLLTVPANHAGIPALSIPGGLDSRGLPIGIQLLGPDFSEASLLRIGYTFEQSTREEAWRRARPAVLVRGRA
jgi:aspartyl-tRNA(Asn)/glutamyl-tRNA(Gln) amidotransferase subunit A